jgi:glycosyltransferase involved in cell wall biosynthesis/2-polyprenyl-3-methyl-5-hydroxy-6-metoxy-1,4-benzoquinol methylase
MVIIPGWSDSAAICALQWCVHNYVPAVAMSESTEWDEVRSVWREAVKRRIVGLFSAALVGGRPQKDYMVKLGMPVERIFLGYDAVDNVYFAQGAKEVRSQRSEARSKYDLPENYFLASARFIEKKNLPRLIQAYTRYRQLTSQAPLRAGERVAERPGEVSGATSPSPDTRHSSPWSLVLLGDGPLRQTLNSQLSTLNLHEHVQMPGFKQYPELPVYYGLAKAFIHASTTEQWGLVVNEAMACGLPVLVSNRCGCAADLVREGVNGFTFDPYNVEQLAQLMLRVWSMEWGVGSGKNDAGTIQAEMRKSEGPSSRPSPRSGESFQRSTTLTQMGDASREIISNWGPEQFANGLKAAIAEAQKTGARSSRFVDTIILRALLGGVLGYRFNQVLNHGRKPGNHIKEGQPREYAVKKLFTETSQEYAGLFLPRKTGKNFTFRRRLSLATEAASMASGKVFDCATGSGEIAASIIATGRFVQATLLDVSPTMLDLASKQISDCLPVENSPQVELISEDGFQFARKNSHRKYDLIVCLGLIAHTGRMAELLLLLRGLLAKDGILLLQSTLLDHPGTRVERFFGEKRYYKMHGYRISYFRHQDIEAACASAGLKTAGCKRYGLGIPFGDRLWPWGNYQLERIFQRWADAHGAEAIYILKTDGES